MNLPIIIRAEGSIVPDGVSITNNRMGRLHVNLRETLPSGQIRLIHFCIPYNNRFDISRWCVDDSVHDPSDFSDWYDRGADLPK
jgi:hypothetical protein